MKSGPVTLQETSNDIINDSDDTQQYKGHRKQLDTLLCALRPCTMRLPTYRNTIADLSIPTKLPNLGLHQSPRKHHQTSSWLSFIWRLFRFNSSVVAISTANNGPNTFFPLCVCPCHQPRTPLEMNQILHANMSSCMWPRPYSFFKVPNIPWFEIWVAQPSFKGVQICHQVIFGVKATCTYLTSWLSS